jgi:hypothetical protein
MEKVWISDLILLNTRSWWKLDYENLFSKVNWLFFFHIFWSKLCSNSENESIKMNVHFRILLGSYETITILTKIKVLRFSVSTVRGHSNPQPFWLTHVMQVVTIRRKSVGCSRMKWCSHAFRWCSSM